MSGMVDDSEDDIIVWRDSTAPSIKISEKEVQVVGDHEKMVVEDEEDDDLDSNVSDCDNEEKDDTEDSNDSVYEKKYYKISEVESIIGESQSTIRFWEESFAELGKNFCSQRSRGGTRKYTKENIENLKLLQLLLRERRLTIEGAISEIKSERKRNVKERALILLKETRDELNNLINAYNYVLHKNVDK